MGFQKKTYTIIVFLFGKSEQPFEPGKCFDFILKKTVFADPIRNTFFCGENILNTK